MMSFNENELVILASYVKERLPKLAKRVAYVVAEDIDYGIGSMWLSNASISIVNQERKLFRNIEEAVHWIVSSQALLNKKVP